MSKKKQTLSKQTPAVRPIVCDLCGTQDFRKLFISVSTPPYCEPFQLVRCKSCGLVQVNPQPNQAAVQPYYGDKYFLRRNRRGYDNYYSEAQRQQICSVYKENLQDLRFLEYEEELFKQYKKGIASSRPIKKTSGLSPRSLDAGCAAGYFVHLMKERGWFAEGIEMASGPVAVARKQGLKIYQDDFLKTKRLKANSYDMISFWASIEHMHSPWAVFQQSANLLKNGGCLLLSTCRYGLLARILGDKWRFMNVPEHLYFFSLQQIKKMAKKAGFEWVASVTYGSGLTSKKEMNFLYKSSKLFLDSLVKQSNQGDMMALHFRKI